MGKQLHMGWGVNQVGKTAGFYNAALGLPFTQ